MSVVIGPDLQLEQDRNWGIRQSVIGPLINPFLGRTRRSIWPQPRLPPTERHTQTRLGSKALLHCQTQADDPLRPICGIGGRRKMRLAIRMVLVIMVTPLKVERSKLPAVLRHEQ